MLRLDTLPVEIIKKCLQHLDIVDKGGRNHVAQTNQILREIAVDAFAYHQNLRNRFPDYAVRPSNSVLLPNALTPAIEEVALASRRACAFHAAKERLKPLFVPKRPRIRVVRNRHAPPFREVEFWIRLGGVDPAQAPSETL